VETCLRLSVAETKCSNAGCIHHYKSSVLPLMYYGFEPGMQTILGKDIYRTAETEMDAMGFHECLDCTIREWIRQSGRRPTT
jgi:hypothetical protein